MTLTGAREYCVLYEVVGWRACVSRHYVLALTVTHEVDPLVRLERSRQRSGRRSFEHLGKVGSPMHTVRVAAGAFNGGREMAGLLRQEVHAEHVAADNPPALSSLSQSVDSETESRAILHRTAGRDREFGDVPRSLCSLEMTA